MQPILPFIKGKEATVTTTIGIQYTGTIKDVHKHYLIVVLENGSDAFVLNPYTNVLSVVYNAENTLQPIRSAPSILPEDDEEAPVSQVQNNHKEPSVLRRKRSVPPKSNRSIPLPSTPLHDVQESLDEDPEIDKLIAESLRSQNFEAIASLHKQKRERQLSRVKNKVNQSHVEGNKNIALANNPWVTPEMLANDVDED